MKDDSFITKEMIDDIRKTIGENLELDYYQDGSVDILDKNGKYIIAVYSVQELKEFVSKYIQYKNYMC